MLLLLLTIFPLCKVYIFFAFSAIFFPEKRKLFAESGNQGHPLLGCIYLSWGAKACLCSGIIYYLGLQHPIYRMFWQMKLLLSSKMKHSGSMLLKLFNVQKTLMNLFPILESYFYFGQGEQYKYVWPHIVLDLYFIFWVKNYIWTSIKQFLLRTGLCFLKVDQIKWQCWLIL